MAILTATKNDWVRLLSVAGAFVKEARISVENGRASCLAIDPAKVAIIKGEIDCKGECPPFTINVDQTLKALNAAGGDPILEFDDYMTTLTVKGNAKVKVPVLADMGELSDINRSMFDDPSGVSVFDPAQVEPIVSYGMYNKEATVTFDLDGDNGFKMTIGTDRNTAEMIFQRCEGKAKSVYPLDYFEVVIKQCKGSDSINVKLPNDNYPVLLDWTVGSGSFSIVIAPRIEE